MTQKISFHEQTEFRIRILSHDASKNVVYNILQNREIVFILKLVS